MTAEEHSKIGRVRCEGAYHLLKMDWKWSCRHTRAGIHTDTHAQTTPAFLENKAPR